MDAATLTTLVQELFSKLGLALDSIEIKTGHRTVVALTSSDSTLAIGPNGEHLRSINTLARRLAEQKHGEGAASFLIDINNHHEEQMERVRQGAQMLAQRARLFKHDVELAPMSPYERLVVHELFAEDPEIETHSEGEGKFRHIVLKYKVH